jgi:hypothetical protein
MRDNVAMPLITPEQLAALLPETQAVVQALIDHYEGATGSAASGERDSANQVGSGSEELPQLLEAAQHRTSPRQVAAASQAQEPAIDDSYRGTLYWLQSVIVTRSKSARRIVAILALLGVMAVVANWLVLPLWQAADPLSNLEREYQSPDPSVLTFGTFRPEPGTKEYEVYLKPGETEIDLNQHYLSGHRTGWMEAFDHWRRHQKFRYTSQDDIYQDYAELESFYPGCWAGYSAARAKIEASGLSNKQRTPAVD